MKKTIIFITLLFIATICIADNKEKRATLDDEHNREIINFCNCNIYVSKANSNEDGNAKIKVKIDNYDKENIILLFGDSYSEKKLKKVHSITFDKTYNGTKGFRDIKTYGISRKDITIMPDESEELPEIQVKNGEIKKCRLPFYVAKYKDKRFLGIKIGRKLVIIEECILDLEIEVPVKPDETFIRLERETNVIIDDISKQKFCNNTKHIPSLEKQEAPYKERINRIKTEIISILDKFYSNNILSTDPRYKKYQALITRLDDNINFKAHEEDCGNPRNHRSQPRHSCKYCNSSLQQIYHKLDDYYKKIYNSSNRKAAKESVMTDVNLLYKCCTDGNCSKHATTWNSSEYKSKITDRYNRICNF